MKNFICFVLGAACGGTAAYLYLKKKFDEKLDAVLEEELTKFYETKGESKPEEPHVPIKTAEPLTTYSKDEKPEYVDYTSFYDSPTDEPQKMDISDNKQNNIEESEHTPIIIASTELGYYSNYEIKDLTYYKDGVLADDLGNIINPGDYDVMFGEDALSGIQSHGDDSLFVRDDSQKLYYSILTSMARYSEISW